MLVVGPEHWLAARRWAAFGMTAVGGESSEGERPILLSAVITRPPGLAGVEVRRVRERAGVHQTPHLHRPSSRCQTGSSTHGA
jgi:hypothetical protein